MLDQEIEISLEERNFVFRGLSSSRGKGPTILALHGWQDNAASFRPLAKALPEQKWIALDLPGHGLSDWVHASAAPDMMNTASLLSSVFAQLRTQGPLHLVGHSLGAGLCLTLAAAFPHDVLSLTLLDALGPLPEKDSGGLDRLRVAAEAEAKGPPRARPFADFTQLLAVRRRATPMAEDSCRLLMERGYKELENGTWQSRLNPRVKQPSFSRMHESTVREWIAGIAARVMLVSAKDSPFAELNAEGRRRTFRQLVVHELEGGHHVHMDRAADIGPLLVQHWAKSHVLAEEKTGEMSGES